VKQRQWRQAILQRDNFRCQLCGTPEETRSRSPNPKSKLEVYHIDPINNDITLCENCLIILKDSKEGIHLSQYVMRAIRSMPD